MSMKPYSYYHSETGLFHRKTVNSSTPEAARSMAPEGHIAIEGLFRFDSHRFDLTSQQVIAYIPDPVLPSVDEISHMALNSIRQLEEKQHRALREQALGTAGALDRLRDIDSQIAELRKRLV